MNPTHLRIGGILFLMAAAAFAAAGMAGDGIGIPQVAGLFVVGLALTVVASRQRRSR